MHTLTKWILIFFTAGYLWGNKVQSCSFSEWGYRHKWWNSSVFSEVQHSGNFYYFMDEVCLFFPLFSSFLVLVLCLWNILQRPWHICRLLNSLSAFKGMCYFRLLCMLKVPIKVNFFQWCILRIAFLLSLDLTQVITIYFDSGTKYCTDCNTGKDII